MMDRFKGMVRPGITIAFALFVLTGGYIAAIVETAKRGAGHSLVELQKEWLNAIPDGAYQLFGATILAYFGAREVGKWGQRKFGPQPDPEISDVAAG